MSEIGKPIRRRIVLPNELPAEPSIPERPPVPERREREPEPEKVR